MKNVSLSIKKNNLKITKKSAAGYLTFLINTHVLVLLSRHILFYIITLNE